MSQEAASGMVSILLVFLGILAFYFFRPLGFFLLALGAFLLPSGFKFFCLIPLLLFVIRYVRLKDTKSLIIFALSIIPAVSMGGHSAWNETAWGKRLAAERAAQPVVLTPAQQSDLAAAREIKAYLVQAKAKAKAADEAMDRDWSASEISQACRLTLQFTAEKYKKYAKLSDQEISSWNNRVKKVEASVRGLAATAATMESDMRDIVAKHFPPDALSGDITPFGTTIDPFGDIPHRTEERINARFADYPQWQGDAQFSALAFASGESETVRKAKGDKFCTSFSNNHGLADQLTNAVNLGLVRIDAEIARLAPPKPTKKFDITQTAKD